MPAVKLDDVKQLINNPTLKVEVGDGFTIQLKNPSVLNDIRIVFLSRSFKFFGAQRILLSHEDDEIALLGIMKSKLNDDKTLLQVTGNLNEGLQKYLKFKEAYEKLRESFGDAVSFGGRD
jgi:hypothetical protein